MRNIVSWAALSALAAMTGTGAIAGPLDKLNVRLSTESPVVQGDASVVVEVAVTNVSGHAVKVLNWQLPIGQLHDPLFKVTGEDGRAARYRGPMVKRAKPIDRDYVRIEAGATLSYRVELSRLYTLGNGRYSVEFVGREGRGVAEATYKSSAPLSLWTSGRSAPVAVAQANGAEGGGITYTGECTAAEKTALADSVVAATEYSSESKSYLNGSASGTKRYVEWFGQYKGSRWNKVEEHFNKIDDAFQTKPLTLDCDCDLGAYAYVIPDEPYKIHLCLAFWDAPMKGTDSKGGTLIHEMSHFQVVADTDDVVYGQEGARKLAKNKPKKAIINADSHEYFAENNPHLP